MRSSQGRGGAGPARAVQRALRRRPGDPVEGSPLLLAVSGGLDSSVLLHAMARGAHRNVTVVTVDHGLHAASASHAESVVRASVALGLACDVVRLDGRALREAAGEAGLEAAARRARYEAMRRNAESRGACLVTAHTRDDALETMLLRAAGGGGLRALAGPARASDGVWRPLLDVPRATLEAYAAAEGVSFVEDPTNADVRFRRNALRREGLPHLDAALGGAWRDGAGRTLEALRALREGLDALELVWPGARLVEDVSGSVRLDAAALRDAPEALTRWVAQRALHMLGVGAHRGAREGLDQLVAALRARERAPATLPSGHVLVSHGASGWLVPPAALEPWEAVRVDAPGEWRVGGYRVRIERGEVSTQGRGEAFVRPVAPGAALHLRAHVVAGDAPFEPVMAGPSTTLRSTLWTRAGVARPTHAALPVLANLHGEVVWAVWLGAHASERRPAGDAAWRIRVVESPPWSAPRHLRDRLACLSV